MVITGERAQESSARAKYKIFEPDRADLRDGKKYKRHVDHYRVVHALGEDKIWELMEKYKVNPHSAYKLSWSRLSCMACIFGSDSQWASVKEIDPIRFKRIAKYEQDFGCTIHRSKNLIERVQCAKPYANMNPLDIAQALDTEYRENIFVKKWKLPAGAMNADKAGPT